MRDRVSCGQPLDKQRAFPLVFELQVPRSAEEFAGWYAAALPQLEARLLSHGALLLRGTHMKGAEDFERLLQMLPLEPLTYASGNPPRIRASACACTSTEHPADRWIPIHNELSYSHVFPSQVLFLCETAAQEGGETPLADSSEVLRRIPPEIVDAFETKQVRYIRNLHGGAGMGPSWHDTFETSDREVVSHFLRIGGADFRWNDDGSLWISQIRPAMLRHPATGAKIWFNQVDQLHPSMFAMFGDDSEIPVSYLEEIRRAIAASTVTFPWKAGDLLVLDNYRIAHGRNPFIGPRKILVSMLRGPALASSLS